MLPHPFFYALRADVFRIGCASRTAPRVVARAVQATAVRLFSALHKLKIIFAEQK